jgi:hypothetical protein
MWARMSDELMRDIEVRAYLICSAFYMEIQQGQ